MWPFKKKPPAEPPRWGGYIRIDRVEQMDGSVSYQPMWFCGSYLGWKTLGFKVFAVSRAYWPDGYDTMAEAEAAADKFWGTIEKKREVVTS